MKLIRLPDISKTLLICCLAFTLQGCNETEIALSALGVTGLGAVTASSEVDQTYYLGVFDPQEQVPPEIYRIRVLGQASFLSKTTFASGWVKADLIDSLSSEVGLNMSSGKVTVDKCTTCESSSLKTGRRLMLFGPEGFREAPKDHRLVIVMGSDPEDYFNAIDAALGAVAEAQAEKRASELSGKLFETLADTGAELERLVALEKDIEVEMPEKKTVAQ